MPFNFKAFFDWGTSWGSKFNPKAVFFLSPINYTTIFLGGFQLIKKESKTWISHYVFKNGFPCATILKLSWSPQNCSGSFFNAQNYWLFCGTTVHFFDIFSSLLPPPFSPSKSINTFPFVCNRQTQYGCFFWRRWWLLLPFLYVSFSITKHYNIEI